MLELPEADDDVRHLDAHVVDVVLRLERRAAEPQGPDERIAERRVAQVTDVRRLVRVDRRMLDDRLLRRDGLGRHLLPDARDDERRTVEVEVQVPVRRRDDALDAGNRAHRLRQFLRDRARRLAKRTRELEGDRDGEIAERAGRRHLDRERRHVGDAEVLADRGRNRVVDVALNAQNHERLTGPTRQAAASDGVAQT